MKTMLTIFACVFMAYCFAGCKKDKKPAKIESHCTMNGYGRGSCSFTNKGQGEGATCIKIRVYQEAEMSKGLTSSTICSGKVGVKETVNKEFSIPGVNGLCAVSGVPWTKVCSFVVAPDNG